MAKILVIEDEFPIRANILEILEAEGFNAAGAEDGRIGARLARELAPDLIICDIMMPEMDGYGVLAEVRHDRATATVPFIFLTAKGERADMRHGMNLGADDYITKPFTRDELLRAIAARLEKQAVQARDKQRLRALFERYVSPRIVEQLVSSPSAPALGGARQTITVLFADIRGFTAFVEQAQPELLVRVLNRYLTVAATAVLEQEGTLDKFMGDAVMAIFNAPVPQPDHALRAVRAALSLQQSTARLHQELPDAPHLHFGVGVATGEAIVGNIGATQLMNYTAVGDCVNVARRLQESARGGQVVLDERTHRLVQPRAQVRPLGPMELRGRIAPEVVYELMGLPQGER